MAPFALPDQKHRGATLRAFRLLAWPFPCSIHRRHSQSIMPTITISGQSYEVAALTEEDHWSYRTYCVLLARRGDNPLERFFERNQNLTPAQQEIALRVERSLPDWSDPPEELVLAYAPVQGRRRPGPPRLAAGQEPGRVGNAHWNRRRGRLRLPGRRLAGDRRHDRHGAETHRGSPHPSGNTPFFGVGWNAFD